MNKTSKMLLPLMALFSSLAMAKTNNIDAHSIEQSSNTKVFYLVRHTEKLKGKNPSLTAQGQLRAIRLARILSSTPVTKVYTTGYNRTRETALVVSQDQHIEPSIYDPHDMDAFATLLLKQQGHILVVGHSNTTTELVEILGGDKQLAIDDATEFDRLYIITVDGSNQMVSTVLLHY
ncbi:SixA phosphatase family protein [Shewanella sp. A14]